MMTEIRTTQGTKMIKAQNSVVNNWSEYVFAVAININLVRTYITAFL